MREWPIRLKIALLSSLTLFIALAMFGAASAWHLYREEIESLDRDLKAEASAIFEGLQHDNRPGDIAQQITNGPAVAWEHRFVELLARDGRVVYQSPNLRGQRLTASTAAIDGLAVTHHDGEPVRILSTARNGTIISIGGSLADAHRALRELMWGYLFSFPLIILAFAFGSWAIARKALKPVEEIVVAAQRITTRNIEERLPILPTNDEIGRLTIVLNGMIDRLQNSFEQMAQFTSDASHELKTPLTIMRGEIESAVRTCGEDIGQENVLMSLLDQTLRLSKIVDNLLLLSRSDAGKLDLNLARVDMSRLVADVAEDAEILAAPQRISVQTEISRHAIVRGDELRLRQILLNLIDNAVKFNRPSGTIGIELSSEDGNVSLTVANTGQTVAPEQAGHLFRRFYRGDASHDRRVEGNGLGLSICHELITAHGGELRLVCSDAERTEFRLTLQAAENCLGEMNEV